MAKQEAPAPLTLEEIQFFTNVYNDIENEMAKVKGFFSDNHVADGLYTHLRRARDDAATHIGLVKKNGVWTQA